MYHFHKGISDKACYPIIRILPILFFLSFTSNGQNKLPRKQQLSFENLVRNIGYVNLPFSQRCGQDIKIIEVDTEIYRYFPPLYPDHPEYGWHIVGKVSENDKYVALLSANTYADYAIPYLLTFTLQGKLIGKLELYKIGCADEESYYSETQLMISKELLINIRDSSATYKLDNKGEIIKQSMKSESNNYRFKLMNDGTIMKDKGGAK